MARVAPMWDVTMTVLVGLMYAVVLVIAVLSLVALPALVVTSWIQRRRDAAAPPAPSSPSTDG